MFKILFNLSMVKEKVELRGFIYNYNLLLYNQLANSKRIEALSCLIDASLAFKYTNYYYNV